MQKEYLDKLIAALDMPVYALEKEIGMPEGTLAKAISGKRKLPAKWSNALEIYATTKIKPMAEIKYLPTTPESFDGAKNIGLFNPHEEGKKAGKIKMYDEIAEWARQNGTNIWDAFAWLRKKYASPQLSGFVEKVKNDPPAHIPNYAEEVGKRFLDLCVQKKANIEDVLVWVEENYGRKPEKARKGEKNESGEEKTEGKSVGSESFQSSLWRKKMGMKD